MVLKRESIIKSFEGELILHAVELPDNGAILPTDLVECAGMTTGDQIVTVNVLLHRVHMTDTQI